MTREWPGCTSTRAPQFPGDPMYPQVVAYLHQLLPSPARETVHGYAAHQRVVVRYS